MLHTIFNERKIIWKLSKNDFRMRYAGSYLGIIWGFIQPIITVLTYWIVFQYGLKIGTPMKDTPYVLWFITGMVPWLFFSEALTGGSNCLLEYSYLVKKLVFNTSILPLIKVISASIVHLIFGLLLTVIYAIYGRFFNINFLQTAFCFVLLFVFTAAIVYSTSALQVFMKDLGQFISVFLQIFMWVTPILWDYHIVPDEYLWIMKLNPMFFVVEGYRKSFLNTGKLWDDRIQFAYFVIVTVLLLVVGLRTFKRLQTHFADVL